MEKNRIRPIAAGKNIRMSYSRQKEVLEMPNLIEVQKDSYKWFLEEGLKEVFDDISPIADYSGSLSLEFVDFELCAHIDSARRFVQKQNVWHGFEPAPHQRFLLVAGGFAVCADCHGGIENKLPERTDQSSGQKCFYHVERQTVRGGDAAYIFFVAFLIFFISFG